MTDDIPTNTRSIFLRSETLEALERHLTEARDRSIVAIGFPVTIGGIAIYAEDDPVKRMVRAWTEALLGRSCCYEDRDGDLVCISGDLLSPYGFPTMKPTPIVAQPIQHSPWLGESAGLWQRPKAEA